MCRSFTRKELVRQETGGCCADIAGFFRAGSVDGLFMADTGLTCCSFAGTPAPDTLVVGSESGVVHFLELPM